MPAALVFAAWRARLVPLWVPIVATAGVLLAQFLQPFGSGLVVLAGTMLVLAYVFSRMDWRLRAQPA